jgi:epsilon-lactone hydrolase
MKRFAAIACVALLSFPAVAAATDLAPLDVPAKALPAPTADISPEMQALVGAPLNPNWNKLWRTAEEARAFADTRFGKHGQDNPRDARAPACQI